MQHIQCRGWANIVADSPALFIVCRIGVLSSCKLYRSASIKDYSVARWEALQAILSGEV